MALTKKGELDMSEETQAALEKATLELELKQLRQRLDLIESQKQRAKAAFDHEMAGFEQRLDELPKQIAELEERLANLA